MEISHSILVLTVVAIIVAFLGFTISRRIFKPIDFDEHQGFLDAMLSIVGTLVSILLGLLVAAAFDHYQALEQCVDNEAANLAQVYRLSLGLPVECRNKIQLLCKDYNIFVLDEEWSAMAKGESSPKVMTTYYNLVSEIATLHPKDDGESNIHAALISAMQEVGDCRRQRLLSLGSTWAKHLMPMLILCSAIVLCFSYLYVKRGAILHAIVICFVAIALGSNLGLVFVLSNPFSGDWRIQPRAFELNKKFLLRLNSMNADHSSVNN